MKVGKAELQSLRVWRLLLAGPAVGVFIFGLMIQGWWVGEVLRVLSPRDCDADDLAAASKQLNCKAADVHGLVLAGPNGAGYSIILGYPAGLAWYFSMRVAVTLADADVSAVIARARGSVLADEERWSAEVADPALRLGTHTMRLLSNGWGPGTGFCCLLFMLMSLGNFIGLVREIRADADQENARAVLRKAVGVFAGVFAPMLIAFNAAQVSSLCDTLKTNINSLRTRWGSTEKMGTVHDRTYPLLCTLERLNLGQGLGFVVYSKVVDRKTLNFAGLSVTSFLGTAIPLIMATMPPPSPQPQAAELCADLTESQRIGLEAWRAMANLTCTLNVTVGPGGVFVN